VFLRSAISVALSFILRNSNSGFSLDLTSKNGSPRVVVTHIFHQKFPCPLKGIQIFKDNQRYTIYDLGDLI
jgi:hypothetical protein